MGDNFLVKIDLFPVVCVILATPFMLKMLLQYGQTICIDGTYRVAELSLVLTTIMVTINGIGVPVAWLLSNSATTANYEWFLMQIKLATINNGTWKVDVCYSDFENALRAAVRAVFPGALLLGDSWHFFYDNRKWVRKNGGSVYLLLFLYFSNSTLILSIHRDDVNTTLHVLWASPTKSDFETNLTVFLQLWDVKFPPYAKYFRLQWISTVPPDSWAGYSFPKCIFYFYCYLIMFPYFNHYLLYFLLPYIVDETGDHKLEGYHLRLKVVGLKEEKKLDFAVVSLRKEADYMEKILTTPILYQVFLVLFVLF